MEVVLFRKYHEHRKEPDAAAPAQDPMPRRQWTDMKWAFARYAVACTLHAEGIDEHVVWLIVNEGVSYSRRSGNPRTPTVAQQSCLHYIAIFTV